MAANKFASMLHKNCHKIIVILVYAVLEWILILLLLLNSFFSYLISKFSNFFGLKPSCTWCCRLDHLFDSKNIANSHFDHVCEAHGGEISKLSYCSSHKRLAESKNLCSNCSSSSPQTINEISSTLAFFTSMSEGISDNGEENRCSCCDQILSRKLHPPLIFKPSWDVLDYIHKRASLSHEDLIKHKMEFEEKGREDDNDDQMACEKDDDGGQTREVVEVQEWNSSQNDDPFWTPGCNEDEESVYLADMLLQNADYTDSDRFICIELIDSPSVSSQQPLTNSSDDAEEERDDDQGPSFEVARVKEAENFSESEKMRDYNLPEPDGYALGGTNNSAIVGKSEEPETSVQDYERGKRHTPEEGTGLEDCRDGSLISEMEVDDECLSKQDLMNTIKAKEKALKELYAELEEERKAAEEGAKETMAMITKVQEEKAAMQIEALQYQRMMEEQAEYDQEALQLLNDLMMKREKEKKELEKELDMYRNKVVDYEEKEKTAVFRRRKSSGESIDNHSIDLDCEAEYDDSRFGTTLDRDLGDSLEDLEGTGGECIKDLMTPDVSLAEFDEERLSILDELKILEAKLFALHDDEEKGTMNSDDHERETTQLVSEVNTSKILMQEELGHVYERLQALEEDKDFLEHCIRSMMKGNKGLVLLQEILQHLRDLKSVELSARNLAEIPVSDKSMIIEDTE